MGSSAVTESRSIFPHGHADFGFRERGGYRVRATANKGRGSGRSELFSLVGRTSDQEGTEEILETKWMAPLGSETGYGHRMANNATGAVDRQCSQNHDGTDSRSNDLDTKPYRRSQIHRRVRLIERGFGQVRAGHDGDTDRCS
jgi:hypothetical protein